MSFHLYTGNNLRKDFPGRAFICMAQLPFKGKELKSIFQLNFLHSQNYCHTFATISRQSEIYLFCR